MLSSFFRSFNNSAIMTPIRDAAKSVAAEFVQDGTRKFFSRWSDNIYNEGMSIKDQKELEKYAASKKKDIEALKRQVVIQQMYKNVEIPN